jgi:hypothetical protein
MDHFLLHPNFSTLSKYIELQDSLNNELNFKDGIEVRVEPFFDSQNDLKFCGDHILEIESGFRLICNKYNISEHYDNLMYLSLSMLKEIDELKFHAEDTYAYKKRSKELAQLLLAFKESGERHFTNLMLKTLTSTVKISEPKLMTWICSLIEDSIQNGSVPYHVLGLEDMQMNDEVQLEIKANQRLIIPPVGFKKYYADFCFHLYPYLINETRLRPEANVLLSDAMANFYFDLLVLLEMLNPNEVQSEPQDYIRTILKNRINRLNIR